MKAAWILAVLAACQSGKAVDEHPATPSPSAVVTASVPRVTVAPGDGPSIYDLDIKIRGGDGREQSLDRDRGQVTLVSMFYGSCPAACPALIGELQRTLTDAGAD